MKLEVLGTGCAKCKTLEEVAKQAIAKAGGFHEVKKVDDLVEIMNYGVMSTPALVIDGKVVSSGKSLSVEEVVALMQENAQ
jgi:small redox-active disulfide protein 2